MKFGMIEYGTPFSFRRLPSAIDSLTAMNRLTFARSNGAMAQTPPTVAIPLPAP